MLNGHKGASCEMRRPRQFKILPFCTEAGQILCLCIVCRSCADIMNVQKVKTKAGAGINSSAVQFEVVIVIVVIMLCV